MTRAQICILIAIVAYLILIVLIGVSFSRRNKNADDFYLGGRRLGPLVAAMSAEASDMSSWLLMGLPGVAFICGVADASWTAIGLAVGTYLNWLIVAKRLRRYTEAAGNAITLPQFFSNRFRDKSKALLFISAAVIIIFFVPYTASGFAACGKLFSSLLGVDYLRAMIVMGVLIIIYTSMGGFQGASTVDLIQSMIMTTALIIVLAFGIHMAGGWHAVVENARSIPGYLSMVQSGNSFTREVTSYGPLNIVSTMAWGLGYFGMPHVLLRFMAIHDDSKIKISRRIASIWVVISMGIAVIIGIVGFGLASNGGLIPMFETSSAAENTVVQVANLMSQFGVIPALVAGLILAGILACTMSTADSQLLAASSAVSRNILQETIGIKLSPRGTMIAARVTLICIAILAMFLARDPNSSVFGIVSFAWAGFGAAFGPVVLFALFWRRANRWGALAGMISGGAMVFIWKFLIRPLGGVWNIYELLPAFIVACIFIVVISLVTPAPEQEIVEEFDRVQAMKG